MTSRRGILKNKYVGRARSSWVLLDFLNMLGLLTEDEWLSILKGTRKINSILYQECPLLLLKSDLI